MRDFMGRTGYTLFIIWVCIVAAQISSYLLLTLGAYIHEHLR